MPNRCCATVVCPQLACDMCQPEHLLVGHKEKLVSLPHNASFTLAHSDSSHVLVLVNDRHPEG